MTSAVKYFPNDGSYFANPFSIYAETLEMGECPNPCRKYHISTDVGSAKMIADAVLPMLKVHRVYNKVVKNEELLRSQSEGNQAGKFITLYMKSSVPQRNNVIAEIAEKLDSLKRNQGARPNPSVPRSRKFHHIFIEQPLDENMFIYGGFVVDSSE